MNSISSILIANRGEIAVRIARTAAELGIDVVAVHSSDEPDAAHLRAADRVVALPGRGVAAYLDIAAMIEAALDAGCDAVHPGYGFLSENAGFAQACRNAGLAFIGPSPEQLALFGDKAAARHLAADLDVPLLPGTSDAISIEDARRFMASLGPGRAIMLKAMSGGGGRGMRVVEDAAELDSAYAACAAEAAKAFGNPDLYAETYIRRARHIEIQVIGDGTGAVVNLGERECTLQRRHQKLIEIAPSPSLSPALREKLAGAACRMAAEVRYASLCTFEFLTEADGGEDFWFIEANPRIQVEHTITEELFGIDLVQAQIAIAGGATLAGMGIAQETLPPPSAMAMQLRINAERLGEGQTVDAASGTIGRYEMPAGPGVRTDGYMRAGDRVSPSFDTLLGKVIVRQQGAPGEECYRRLLGRAARALRECRIGGVPSNIAFLSALIASEEVSEDRIYTRFVEDSWDRLRANALLLEPDQTEEPNKAAPPRKAACPAGATPLPSSGAGMIVRLCAQPGEIVAVGQVIAVVEAMKMETAISAPFAAVIHSFALREGEVLDAGEAVAFLIPTGSEEGPQAETDAIDLDAIPPLLADELARRRLRLDQARPEAVASRRRIDRRTVRENIGALCDNGSFVEYGGLALPSQRRRRSMEELQAMGPADGLVTGTATINAELFPGTANECLVLGYDYTAFAGTQGWANHRKLERMLQIATKRPRPMVIFAEGGGGRPGETDQMRASGLDNTNFANLARLSGKAPLVGIVSGRCFAGNAALLGCCDLIVATPDATIGMGGPAMIEGGGLGRFAAEEVGPADAMVTCGVIDLLAADEADAVHLTRTYLSYFQGDRADWTVADQRLLRHLVPENRRQAYDVRAVVAALADEGSLLELRPSFGAGLITVLARIEGRPVGLIANDPRVLGGAIDSNASDKGARFLRLCELFALPVVSLCDTPGFMVGPASERTGAVRHMSRLFLAGANLSVPMVTVVIRRGFGLGAMAMSGGGTREPDLTIAWPTAQFGAMGPEGAVRLGYRRELEAMENAAEREALFNSLVEKLYEDGRPHNAASFVEIDDVVDPAETRGLIAGILRSYRRTPTNRTGYLDSW